MGKSSKILSNTLIILLLIGAGYFGYSYFFDGFSFTFSTDTDIPIATSYPEFVSLLSDLRSIDLDEGDLLARTLASLKDFSVAIPIRPTGRLNPFAPIGTANRQSGIPVPPITDTPDINTDQTTDDNDQTTDQ